MIGFKLKGDFRKTRKHLLELREGKYLNILKNYGQKGVDALSAATPVDTGLTANSWYYKIEMGTTVSKIVFCNSNVQNGIPIAIILQTGHGTRNGGWVEGRDYINPAIQPVFDEIAKGVWKEVTKL
jgi:hypothetical protein